MSTDTKHFSSKRSTFLFAVIFGLFITSIFNSGFVSGYTTDTSIYTPPQYLTFQPPAKGGSYTDPVFGTAVKRLSDSMHTVNAANGSGMVTLISPEYSTMSPFNQDNSRLILAHFGYYGLYDGAGNYLKDLPFEINASSEPRWARTDPNVLYYHQGNRLKQHNVGTGLSSVVRTFSEYSSISGRGESDISPDGDHFVLAGDGRYVFVYEISTNSKGPVFDTGGRGVDSLYIYPSNSISITWNANGNGARFTGIELFDRNMNFQRQLAHAGGHMDESVDTNGDEVLLWSSGGDPWPQTTCGAGVVKIRLSDARQTCIWNGDWSMATHVSAPDNSGWVFVENYVPSDPIPPSGWNKYTDEILQVKLDGSEIRRLVHHRSRPLNSYTYMPKVSVSRDGSKLVYTSNFGLQAQLGYPTEYADAYMIDLSGASPGTSGAATGGTTTTTGSTGSTTDTAGPTTPPSTAPPSTGSTGSTTPSTGSATGTTRVEQNGNGVTYSGTWMPNSLSAHSGSSAVLSMDPAATATFTFNGNGANWIAYRDEWSGIAQVFVDGTLKSEMDTFASPSQAHATMYSVSGLSSGSHTLVVKVTGRKNASSGGSWVWVDAFDVTSNGTTTTSSSGGTAATSGGTTSTSGGTTPSGGTTTTPSGETSTPSESATSTSEGTATTTPPPPGPTGAYRRTEQNDAAVRFSGVWSLNNGEFNSGKSAKLSMAAGARATFAFTGEAVNWLAYQDQSTGIARVYIDGTFKEEVDTYALSAKAATAAYTISGLPWGDHTIAIEATGRKNPSSKRSWVWVDAFDYIGETIASSNVTNDPGPASIAGGISLKTSGGAPMAAGSAKMSVGPYPSGLAVVSYRPKDVLVSETSVSASEPKLKGRIPVEIAGSVNTGFAIANPNDSPATISFFFTDSNGTDFGSGNLTLAPHAQLSRFLDQSPFNAPHPTGGTFTFSANVRVSTVALRALTNERSEFLMTTLPVADPDQSSAGTTFFPQFADGSGWRTQFFLINPSDEAITGTLRFLEQGVAGAIAQPMSVTINNASRTSLAYSIPPRSSRLFSTAGTGTGIRVGTAQATPNMSSVAPVGVAVFSFKQNGVTVSEAGVKSRGIGQAFRMYVESGGSIQTGIAVMNSSDTDARVRLELTGLDGVSTGLAGSLVVPAGGQRSLFLGEIPGLASLPASFKGIARISSTNGTDLSIVGVRGHWNERREFLFTTTDPNNEVDTASDVVFPLIVDGGGYTTQFVLYSGNSNEPATGSLNLFSQSGGGLNLTLK